MNRHGTALFLIASLLLPARALSQELSAELFASQTAYAPFGSFTPETGVGASLLHASHAHRVAISGGQSMVEGGATWGALSLFARPALLRASPWTLRLDLEGSGFAFANASGGDGGQGLIARGGPLLEFNRGGVHGSVEALMGTSAMRWGAESWSRSAPEIRGRTGFTTQAGLSLGVSARSLHAPEGAYGFAGTEAAWNRPALGAWASAGRWFGESSGVEMAAGAWAGLGRRAELHLSFQQTALDPLLLAPGVRGWSLSLRVPLGRSATASIPLVRSEGEITFRIPAREAPGRPYLLGDFTGWQPVPMQREGGAWTATVRVERGVHLYAFRTEEGRVFLPRSVEARRPDGFGGENGVLIIP